MRSWRESKKTDERTNERTNAANATTSAWQFTSLHDGSSLFASSAVCVAPFLLCFSIHSSLPLSQTIQLLILRRPHKDEQRAARRQAGPDNSEEVEAPVPTFCNSTPMTRPGCRWDRRRYSSRVFPLWVWWYCYTFWESSVRKKKKTRIQPTNLI